MAEFLCILTDLVSLHFMVLFCFDSLRSGPAVCARSTATSWDRKIYENESDSRSASPMLLEEEGSGWGYKEEEERLDLSSDGPIQGDWCPELSSSCRLQLLPFHINYTPAEYPGSDMDVQSKQDGPLPPSSKSLSSVSGRSVWVEVDSLKDGSEHLPSSGKSSERDREREMCEGTKKESDRERESKSDTDNGACEYVQQYGSYLNLDLVAACCSLRELPLALDCTLLVSGADQQLDTLSSSLGEKSIPFYYLLLLKSFYKLFSYSALAPHAKVGRLLH
jgi:hypothetical protein